MASVTQTIPTLTGGISQQPDELKIPGQVSVATNVIPDVTHGLLKRPGSKLVKSLSDDSDTNKNSHTNGKWFSYYRDETESYIGQISRAGDINMWDCSNGNPVDVNFTPSVANALATYLIHNNDEDIQTLTLNDYTFITNRTRTVAMSSTKEPARPPEVFIDLRTTAYARQYSVNLYDNDETTPVSTATRISVELVRSSNNSCSADGHMLSHADRLDDTVVKNRCDVDADEGRDAFAPNVGTRIFSINSGEQLIDENAVGGKKADDTKTDTDYAYTVGVYKKAFSGTYVQNDTSATVTVTTASPHGLSTNDVLWFKFTTQTTESLTIPNNTNATITVVDSTSFTFTHPVTNEQGGNLTGNVNCSEINQPNRKSLYFRIRTTGQSVPFTTGSGSSAETTYRARYTTTHDLLYGGEGWKEGDYFYVWMKDGYYKITVDAISSSKIQSNLGLVRPNPTPFDTETTVTAASILGDLRNGILGTNYGGVNSLYQFRDEPANGYEVKQIGNGLYITRPTSEGVFNITAPSTDLLKVMSTEVKNVDDLPDQCKHGYVVKVANSEADEDDYYLKFFGKLKDGVLPENATDDDYLDGAGVWEECAKPGDNIEFNKGTMPIQLVREANGTFTVSQVDYDKAEVGTTVVGGTNPRPSFVGHTINQLVFFRNRLVFLSDENVIMSRPGDFFNFWCKTATTFTPQDVIDLSTSSEYPAIVYDGIQINAGLLLFTKNQQFMLTTDSDVLSPETAKLNAVSTYNFNEKTNPVSLGTTVAFLDNANKFSRFFEMSNVVRQGEPTVVDQSKVISRLLSKNISIISESRENSVVFFSQKGTKEIYGFRYFSTGDERLLQSWFTWKVNGDIQYHCMLDDALYVVLRNNSKDQMVKYSLKLDDSGFFVTDTNETTDTDDDDFIYRVHLDHASEVTAGSNTYNAITNKTTIPKPHGYESTKQLVAYDNDQGTNLGRYSMITVDGSNLVIDGPWQNNAFIIGYLYEMDVQIPTLYVTQQVGSKYRADAKSSLIIHRVKFSFGPLGVYSSTIKRKGKPDFTEDKELGLAGFVKANRLPMVTEVIETLPCYERNTNLTINIKSSHPSPASLYSLAWEGDFTNRFYRRV